MTIRRLPDFRIALLDRWLCRRLPPHDTRVLVKEYVEGLANGFHDNLPVRVVWTIMDFAGTENVHLFWTHRWWMSHRAIFLLMEQLVRVAAATACLAEATATLEADRAELEALQASLQDFDQEIRVTEEVLEDLVAHGGAAVPHTTHQTHHHHHYR